MTNDGRPVRTLTLQESGGHVAHALGEGAPVRFLTCPICSHDRVRVLRTDGPRRRRECLRCRHRWATVEIDERQLHLLQRARAAVLEAADRLKVA
jgi:hypothetical protein